MSGIGDGPYANGICGGVNTISRIHFSIEGSKFAAIKTAIEGIGVACHGAAFKAAQAIQRILRPANAFAKFTITGNINTDLGLLRDNVRHRMGEAGFIGGQIERFARLLGADEIFEVIGADEAADMCGQNPVCAALHNNDLMCQEFRRFG